MKIIRSYQIVLFVLALFVAGCSFKQNNEQAKIVQFFSDKGRLLDSLKNVYHFESVSFNKIDDTNVSDSTFCIEFVNAKKLPSLASGEVDTKHLNEIVLALKGTLNNPNKFSSYQIVFVEIHYYLGHKFEFNQIMHVVLNREL